MSVLNDGVNTKDSLDSTAPCYAQVSAEEGNTFVIDEVKIFLNNLLSKTPFVDGNLIL